MLLPQPATSTRLRHNVERRAPIITGATAGRRRPAPDARGATSRSGSPRSASRGRSRAARVNLPPSARRESRAPGPLRSLIYIAATKDSGPVRQVRTAKVYARAVTRRCRVCASHARVAIFL